MLYRQYIEKAKQYVREKNYDKAIENFTVAWALNPDTETALLLGQAYYNNEKYHQAIEKFENAIELSGTEELRMIAVTYIANCFARKGAYKKALNMYESLLTLFPQNRRANFKFCIGTGYCYYSLAKEKLVSECNSYIANANFAYQKAQVYAEDNYEFGMVYNGLASVSQLQGNDNKAIELFEKAIELYNGKWRAEAFNGMALSLARVGQGKKAHEVLKEARKIFVTYKNNDGFGRNLMTAGIIEKEQGNMKEAFRFFVDAEKKIETKELYKLIAETAYYLADLSKEKEDSARYLAKYYNAMEKLEQEEIENEKFSDRDIRNDDYVDDGNGFIR